MKHAAAVTPLVFCLLLVLSCTVETDIRIHDDASGRASVTVKLHPVAVRYMTDLMSALDVAAGDVSVFDIESIRRSFAARPGVELTAIDQIGEDTLSMELTFEDIRTLLEGSGRETEYLGRAPLRFSRVSGRTELVLRLSRSNFGHISGLFVLPDSPLTVLLPYSVYDFMPEDEYREILEYALGEYLEGSSVEELLEGQGISAYIETDRGVKEIEGGKLQSGRAYFFIPLIDVLTLERETLHSLVW